MLSDSIFHGKIDRRDYLIRPKVKRQVEKAIFFPLVFLFFHSIWRLLANATIVFIRLVAAARPVFAYGHTHRLQVRSSFVFPNLSNLLLRAL